MRSSPSAPGLTRSTVAARASSDPPSLTPFASREATPRVGSLRVRLRRYLRSALRYGERREEAREHQEGEREQAEEAERRADLHQAEERPGVFRHERGPDQHVALEPEAERRHRRDRGEEPAGLLRLLAEQGPEGDHPDADPGEQRDLDPRLAPDAVPPAFPVPGVLQELRAETRAEELRLLGQVAVPDH